MWQSADPAVAKYLPNGDRQHDQNLPGLGGVYNPMNLGMYAYAGMNPLKYTDPTGQWFGFDDAFTGPVDEIIVLGGLYLMASAGSKWAEENLDKIKGVFSSSDEGSDSERPQEHGPRPLTDDEIGRLSDAGRELDPADRGGKSTKAGRARQKHGSREGSAFPPVSGSPEDHNDQGQETLDGILNDPGSTIEVDDRGRATVLAPDGRGVRYNPDGSMQGFREPKPPSGE